MNALQTYRLWLENTKEREPELYRELLRIENDPEEISSRFHSHLSFGTAGLRGIIGAGTNRMNVLVIRRTTQGLADYIIKKGFNKAVAIAYDTRLMSGEFAREAACVLAANGVTAYLSDDVMATPNLSYAVRLLNCGGGINITASHNPHMYNGYKCYGPDGCQMAEEPAAEVSGCISQVEMFGGARTGDFEALRGEGRIKYMPPGVRDDYIDRVTGESIFPQLVKMSGLRVVYTPLNGVGGVPVRAALKRLGVEQLKVVAEQERPDPYFTTCPYPNPEQPDTFELAFREAEAFGAHVVIATDPDSDRLGVAVKNQNGGYTLLSGDEVGCLLLHYILVNRKRAGALPQVPVFVNTIVSSPMGKKIADAFGCETRTVLTGFKYIGGQMALLAEEGQEERFVFGYEESVGYTIGTHARDKDAVVASMMFCEMAAAYHLQGLSVLDALEGLYERYGRYVTKMRSFEFQGPDFLDAVSAVMRRFRESAPETIAGMEVTRVSDYQASESLDTRTNERTPLTLPKSNVLGLYMGDTARVMLRPSGTEPKLKMYFSALGDSRKDADAAVNAMERELVRKFESL